MKIAIVGFHFCCKTGERNRKVWIEYAKLYPEDEIHIYTGRKYLWDTWKQSLNKRPLQNLHIHQITILFSKFGQFKYAFPTILFELVKLNPDVVYASEEPIQPFVTWLCALYAKVKGKPFFFFTYENQKKDWFFPISFFEKFCVNNAKMIVCATKKAADILIEKFRLPADKIKICPETGIDLKIFRKTVPRRDRGDVVLFVGRFIPEKGIKEIIKAKRILDKKGKRYVWLFVGSGPLRDYIKSEGGKNIKILDWVTPSNLAKYYNMAKVFVYPSLRTKNWEEQFGYSMIESLACGTPVITTPNTGALEIIPDKSAFVPFGNSRALAEKIEKIMGVKREFDYRGYLENNFSLVAVAKKWREVFLSK